MWFLALYIFVRLLWRARETLLNQPPGLLGDFHVVFHVGWWGFLGSDRLATVSPANQTPGDTAASLSDPLLEYPCWLAWILIWILLCNQGPLVSFYAYSEISLLWIRNTHIASYFVVWISWLHRLVRGRRFHYDSDSDWKKMSTPISYEISKPNGPDSSKWYMTIFGVILIT